MELVEHDWIEASLDTKEIWSTHSYRVPTMILSNQNAHFGFTFPILNILFLKEVEKLEVVLGKVLSIPPL